ncbi:MAG TPA: M48 family metallopeptidase [Nitrococcus sp.]|nr:M48 family metallopeptidase [Nitrococcus sp.]
MTGEIEGWWFDGYTAGRRRVRLARAGGQLRLVEVGSGEEVACLGLAGLRLTEEVYRGQPLRLAHPDSPDAILAVEDHRLIEWLRDAAPRLRRRYLARHSTCGRFALWGGALITVVAMLALAVPRTATLLAAAVPAPWAQALGKATVDTFAGSWPTCREPQAQAALEGLVARLAVGTESPYRLAARVFKAPIANAAAVGGGHIILFSGLLELMQTPEELAAVLAHEIAHGVKRHPLQALLRHMGYRLLLALMVGDTSAGAGLMSEAARFTLERSYSRADEAAADELGMMLLNRAGIDSRGAARFFRRLAGQKDRTAPPVLLATHPGLAERIAASEARQRPGAPALTPAAWRAVKVMCGSGPDANIRG